MDHNEMLELILENSVDMILLVADDGRAEYVTPSVERVLGWPPERFRSRSAFDLIHPDDLERVIGGFVGTFAPGAQLHPERFRVARSDGGWAWVDAHVTYTPDRSDVVIVTARDVSEEVAAAAASARQSERRRRAEARLVHASLHDPLTGLANRELLGDRIDQAVRRAHRTGVHAALLFCDIDRFKVVNDALGHSVGDQLLTVVARRLRSCLRESDTVARFGGDEFVVLSEDLATDEDASVLARRLHEVLDEPIVLGHHTIHVTISTGVAIIDGTQARERLLSDSDAAMYAAKDAGRNRFVECGTELRERATDRLRIEADLRHALADGTGLAVHLQPEVDLATRAPVGYEALIRWTLPDGTGVPPDRFLPIAGDAGLMHRVGYHAVTGVAEALTRLAAHGSAAWVSVNASAEELHHPDFAEQIHCVLRCRDVDLSRLCIEITEHSILADPAGVDATLRPLREVGATVAIDDFGTGYSSLAYLTRFRPEFVKIDRAFTHSIVDRSNERAVVAAVLQLADTLGITAVAEGVETEEQASLLTEMGCTLAQGWHFGRPEPLDRVVGSH